MRIIAIVNQKGGVGKTITAINLGVGLQRLGNRVLLADIDPQGALSAGLGVSPSSHTISDVLQKPDLPVDRAIIDTGQGPHLIPSNLELASVEFSLMKRQGREELLKDRLSSIARHYDYILVDCPPSLGLLTVIALVAAREVLIPVQTEYFALRGMDILFNTIDNIKAKLNPELGIAGILATMYDKRTTHSKEVLQELRHTYGRLVYGTVIKRTIKLSDGALDGRSIFDFRPRSEAAAAYQSLSEEVHYGKANRVGPTP